MSFAARRLLRTGRIDYVHRSLGGTEPGVQMKLARLIRIDAIDAARLSDGPPIQASPVRRWVPAWRLPRSGFGSCRRAAETPQHQDGFALTELDKVALQST